MPEARARRLYHWLVSNVEDGREADGRRVVIGKSGHRATGFVYLCRAVGIPVEMAVAKDRLSPVPLGPISEVEQFDDFIIRVEGSRPEWITFRDKFAPYGDVPAGVRGQPVYRLIDRRAVVNDRQESDRLVLERVIDVPAGRVEPAAYMALQKFARQADEATTRDLLIRLGK